MTAAAAAAAFSRIIHDEAHCASNFRGRCRRSFSRRTKPWKTVPIAWRSHTDRADQRYGTVRWSRMWS